jgi:hypothetical protein
MLHHLPQLPSFHSGYRSESSFKKLFRLRHVFHGLYPNIYQPRGGVD